MIVILVHRAGKRVLDGNNGARHAAFFQIAKNIFEALAGQHLNIASQQLARGLLAKSATGSLECNCLFARFHWGGPSQRRAMGSGRPIRSSTRLTEWSTTSIRDCGF